MDLVIRDADGSDLNFIYSTWLDSYRYDSYFGRSHRNGIFFNDYRQVLDGLLSVSSVRVAHVIDEPQAILGYIVFESPNRLHYVYTKGPFQGLGVGRKLFQDAFKDSETPLYFTHKTQAAIPILRRHPRFVYRGTALLKTLGEPTHAQTED